MFDARKQALVNIPVISERSIRREIASSAVTMTSEIQVHMCMLNDTIRNFPQMTVLDEAVSSHPNSWLWLKADRCDINEGLKESVWMKWSRDVDLNDGSMHSEAI